MFDRINIPRTSSKKSKSKKVGNLNKKASDSAIVNEVKSEQVSFEEILKQETTTLSDDQVISLFSDLDKVAASLEKDGKLDDFIQYKNLIKKLIKFLVPNSQQLNNNFYRNPSSMNEYFYKTVSVIDNELDTMLIELKKEHKNKLDLTEKIVSIRGLLLDIVIKH